jgi:hypothetical protein
MDLAHAMKRRWGVDPVAGVLSGPSGVVNGRTGVLDLEDEEKTKVFVVVGRPRVGHGV